MNRLQTNRVVWRWLVTCLLLVALPPEGVAATGMWACVPAHHQAGGWMSTAVSHAQPPQQHVQKTGHHAHMAKSAGDEKHASAQHGSAASGAVDLLKGKCSQCAPCCSGAAMPAVALTAPCVQPAGMDLPLIRAHYASADIVGLDRPPRSLPV